MKLHRHCEETMTKAKLDLKKKNRLRNAICFPYILHNFKETHKGSKITFVQKNDQVLGTASKFQNKIIKALVMDLYIK